MAGLELARAFCGPTDFKSVISPQACRRRMRNFRQEPQAAEARKKAGELYHASLAEHDE